MTNLAPMVIAVQQAVRLTQHVASAGIDASAKSDDSPVTIADYGAQALICRAIAEHYPQDRVIAEEGGAAFRELVPPEGQARVASLLSDVLERSVSVEDVMHWLDHGADGGDETRTWVIDPIDGTVGFVNGRHYAICVALMEDFTPTHSVMGVPRSPLDPNGTILYTAEDGLFAMAADATNPRRVRASERRPSDGLRVMDSIKLPQSDLDLNTKIRAAAGVTDERVELYDSQLKYGMVAAGYGDIFVRLPRDITAEPHYIWDHAPGAALLRAGGATYTDLRGRPVDFSDGERLPHHGFIASNGQVHEALVRGVRSVLGEVWGF